MPANQESSRQLSCIVPPSTVATTVDVYVIADNQQALPGLVTYSYGLYLSSIGNNLYTYIYTYIYIYIYIYINIYTCDIIPLHFGFPSQFSPVIVCFEGTFHSSFSPLSLSAAGDPTLSRVDLSVWEDASRRPSLTWNTNLFNFASSTMNIEFVAYL